MNLSEQVLNRRVFNKAVNDDLQQTTILSELDPYIDRLKDAVDVGAATGHVTHFLAPRVRNLWAFEAVEPVYQQLKKMELIHPNVRAYHAAISDFNGPGTIYVDDKRLSNSGFQDLVGGPSVKVETFALDTFYDPDTRLGFVKIDVEGTEFDVIKGMRRIIEKDRPNMMVEIYEPYSKYPLNTIFDEMFGWGYRCFYYDQGLVEIHSAEEGVEAVKTLHKVHDGDFLFVARTPDGADA